MDPDVEQGYRLHCVLSNLNRLDIDKLDDADQERVETARSLLEEVNNLTRLDNGNETEAQSDS
jgi:molybdopterin/thiamine biosynthesis adenylyltransferase